MSESELEGQIDRLVAKAERHLRAGNAGPALEALHEAWELLPAPRTEQRVALMVAGGLGDVYGDTEDYGREREWAETALRCPGGAENASVHLRLGQALFHMGERKRGVAELVRAKELGDDNTFRSVDPAYHLLVLQEINGADLSWALPDEFRPPAAEVCRTADARPANSATNSPDIQEEALDCAPAVLPEAVGRELDALCERGNAAMEDERYAEAAQSFWQGWELLPEPKLNWDASLWLLASLGDSQYLSNNLQGAHDYFRYALQAPEGTGNGFVWLRLGQCLALLGDKEAAVDPLARAYLLEGAEIFEDEDPEFLRLATSQLEPCAS